MIDKNKVYKTRDGREVRIYATDGEGRYPIHGAVRMDDGWLPRQWTRDGELSEGRLVPSYHDLIEVRPRHKRTVWLNVYPDDIRAHMSEEQAEDIGSSRRLACLRVDLDFCEGEGL